MSSLESDLLTSIFKPLQPAPQWPIADRAAANGRIGRTPPPVRQNHSVTRRTRIWDLHDNFHCSIIGTCLSTGELRRVLVRLGVVDAETSSDHELHNVAVEISRRPEDGGKFLQKALDRRHAGAINQFAKAKDSDAIAALWQRAQKQGDIPGAYWALLTHPLTNETLVKQAFSDVHMLSHLVGAANRADIRRLRQLEEENTALVAKLDRQQRHLRDGFIERDGTIRRLSEALSRALESNREVRPGDAGEDRAALTDTIADLKKTLARETARRERFEQRLTGAAESMGESEKARRRAESRAEDLESELAALEARLDLFAGGEGDGRDALDLGGATILYVGGRNGQVPRLKAVVERVGGRFLHHDGGIDHNAALLPGFVSQCDLVVFPVDCVSHSAVGAIKRLSQQCGKRYIPLRTASIACLLAALSGLQTAAADAHAGA